MSKLLLSLLAALIFTFFANSAIADGIEIKLTVSGKLLLGIAYRHQIDPNTAIRFGSYMGVSGSPVGLKLGIVQDFAATKEWTPTFGLEVDALIYKKDDLFAKKIYPSAVFGVSYCPQPNLRHSGELWLGWLNHAFQSMGLSYLYLSKLF